MKPLRDSSGEIPESKLFNFTITVLAWIGMGTIVYWFLILENSVRIVQ